MKKLNHDEMVVLSESEVILLLALAERLDAVLYDRGDDGVAQEDRAKVEIIARKIHMGMEWSHQLPVQLTSEVH